MQRHLKSIDNLPFAIPVTPYFGVDDVKARAAGKIFQVLRSQVSPSPGVPIPVPKCETSCPSEAPASTRGASPQVVHADLMKR